MKSSHTGIKRILKAFTYSYDGFKATFKSEAAFRQDLAVFVIGSIVAACLPLAITAKALMVSALILILLMELANSAVEAVVDRISDEYHTLSKKAKDIGSLLVLIAFINAFIIWGAVIYQHYF